MNYCNKILIVKGTIPKKMPCLVTDFEEEYSKYTKKFKKLRTRENFSLEFDSTLEDLKRCHFIYVDNEKLELLIKKRLNVIEEI